MEKFFLGCDWGTSSFRLRLFDRLERKITCEVSSSVGISIMHNNWNSSEGAPRSSDKRKMYQDYLAGQIVLLSQGSSVGLDGIPVVISGMASSSIGLDELPYAALPFDLDGDTALVKTIEATSQFPHDIILVSGVQSATDVMRGEETQLIGVAALLQEKGSRLQEAVLIFPGTHSKHIHLNEGRMVDFQTFMTGELFNVISQYTILKDSIQKKEADATEIDIDAFVSGVKQAAASSILNGLFRVRTNQLFSKYNKYQNSSYLSGLLIGEELKYLVNDDKRPIYLCSGKTLFGYYKLALEALDLANGATIFPFDSVDQAAVFGQQLILQKQKIKVDA